MTPTEQDKGDLVHQIAAILAKNKVKITPETTLMHDFLQLITADRKRVALEAQIEAYEKAKNYVVGFNSNTIEWIENDIAELKAQQEEV